MKTALAVSALALLAATVTKLGDLVATPEDPGGKAKAKRAQG